MSQFNDYATKSKWSPIINLGCNDRLRGRQPQSGARDPQCHAAYMHGWQETDAAENKAGRPMPEQKIANRKPGNRLLTREEYEIAVTKAYDVAYEKVFGKPRVSE